MSDGLISMHILMITAYIKILCNKAVKNMFSCREAVLLIAAATGLCTWPSIDFRLRASYKDLAVQSQSRNSNKMS